MNEIISIQKEFETLVAELEKLKSINELSSANANNTAKVVKATDSLVKKINDFQEKLEKYYQTKENQLDKISAGFNKVFENSDKSIRVQQDKFSKTVLETQEEFSKVVISTQDKAWKEVKSRIQDMETIVLRFLNEIKDIKAGFKKNVDDFVLEYSVNLEDFREVVMAELASLEKLNLLEKILIHLQSQKTVHDEQYRIIGQRFADLEDTIISKTRYQLVLQITTLLVILMGVLGGAFFILKFVL